MALRRASRKPSAPRPGRPAGAKLIFSDTIANTPQALDPLISRLVETLGNFGCLDDTCTDIELALREALANAILHGNGGNPRQRVALDCFRQKDHSILLVIRDQGQGFDPAGVADPCAPENIYRVGGRGIFLMRHFMDEVSFRRKGSEIRMRKKL